MHHNIVRLHTTLSEIIVVAAALSRSMHEIRCDISTAGAIALGHNSIPEINIFNTKSTSIRPSSNSLIYFY